MTELLTDSSSKRKSRCTVKLCVDDFGKERPTEFSTKDKPSYTLLVLKRE
jgi:hypothetical protein